LSENYHISSYSNKYIELIYFLVKLNIKINSAL
jgi:hypothetical protein